jgi:HAD superfamily hydrolase (TIGR01509 family)
MRDSVIFDMDGVLLDSERIFNSAWRTVGGNMCLPGIEDALKNCVGCNDTDTRVFLQDKYGAAFNYAQFIGDVEREFEALTALGGLPLKPGVTEILTWLRDAGVSIGLATSTSRNNAMRHLENAGLHPFFKSIVTGDMIRNGKPDPEIYLLACEKLGVLPQQCFAIEDSPNGIKAAHAAGLKTIMVPDQIAPTPELEHLLHKKFDSLLDAKAYFESL